MFVLNESAFLPAPGLPTKLFGQNYYKEFLLILKNESTGPSSRTWKTYGKPRLEMPFLTENLLKPFHIILL